MTSHARGHGRTVLFVLLALLLGAIALLWAWNAIAVELFAAPAARFKHALAFEFALAALMAMPLLAARLRSRI